MAHLLHPCLARKEAAMNSDKRYEAMKTRDQANQMRAEALKMAMANVLENTADRMRDVIEMLKKSDAAITANAEKWITETAVRAAASAFEEAMYNLQMPSYSNGYFLPKNLDEIVKGAGK